MSSQKTKAKNLGLEPETKDSRYLCRVVTSIRDKHEWLDASKCFSKSGCIGCDSCETDTCTQKNNELLHMANNTYPGGWANVYITCERQTTFSVCCLLFVCFFLFGQFNIIQRSSLSLVLFLLFSFSDFAVSNYI